MFADRTIKSRERAGRLTIRYGLDAWREDHQVLSNAPILFIRLLLPGALLFCAGPKYARAQAPPAEKVDTVEVLGLGAARGAEESFEPVNVWTPSDLRAGVTEMGFVLSERLPWLNMAVHPASGPASITRPMSLRGLAPDHILVLVDGKRRHRAAAISWWGAGTGDLGQGPELSPIPLIALSRVELLRGGASARYGSGAVAGVLNFRLRDAAKGGVVEASGALHDGAGRRETASAFAAHPLGERGSASIAVEYGRDGNVDRSEPGQPPRSAPGIDDDLKIWARASYGAARSGEFYGHLNYGYRKVFADHFARRPYRAGHYATAAGDRLLVGDLADARDGVLDGSAGCPDAAIRGGVPNPDAWIEIQNNAECYALLGVVPNGFVPKPGGNLYDFSTVLGYRVQRESGLSWDLTLDFGGNAVLFFVDETLNPSTGPSALSLFDTGFHRQQELVSTAEVGLPASDGAVALGLEWRIERFEVGAGEEASWTKGPLADQGFLASVSGFPGFSPDQADFWRRHSFGARGEYDVKVGPLGLSVAGRAEYYTDAGLLFAEKAMARYELPGGTAIRANIGGNYRAPTLAQQFPTDIAIGYDAEVRDIRRFGVVPAESLAGEMLGAEKLRAERSTELGGGFVMNRPGLSLALDYFLVRVRDRMALSNPFDLTEDERGRLRAAGETLAAELSAARVILNAFSTRTRGAELSLASRWEASGGSARTALDATYARTTVAGGIGALSPRRLAQMEEALPRVRLTAIQSYERGRAELALGVRAYGAWTDAMSGTRHGAAALIDASAAWRFSFARLSVGVRNAGGRLPKQGGEFGFFSPYGVSGALFHASLSQSW